MRGPSISPRARIALWVTLAVIAVVILVPAALRTLSSGLKGDFDPDVRAARQHAQQVELEQAKAEDTITRLESSLRASNKILEGTGSKTIPMGVIMAELPYCELEDGSTQILCVWDGKKQGNKTGAIVVNLAHGRISFYPQTDGWLVK